LPLQTLKPGYGPEYCYSDFNTVMGQITEIFQRKKNRINCHAAVHSDILP